MVDKKKGANVHDWSGASPLVDSVCFRKPAPGIPTFPATTCWGMSVFGFWLSHHGGGGGGRRAG